MNWDAIGAVSEGLGSCAVLITLVYLSVQIRHARKEARRALGQGRGEAIRDLMALSADERINRARVKADAALGVPPRPYVAALIERAGMTREEAYLLFQHTFAWWNYYVQIIPHVDELSEIERHQFEVSIRNRYAASHDRLYFETQRNVAHPDAVRYIDRLLAQSP